MWLIKTSVLLCHCIGQFSLENIFVFIIVVVWLPPATKAPRGRPSPRRGAEENGKKQAETGGSG